MVMIISMIMIVMMMMMMMMMRDTTKIPIMIARMPMKITDEETAEEEGSEFYPSEAKQSSISLFTIDDYNDDNDKEQTKHNKVDDKVPS